MALSLDAWKGISMVSFTIISLIGAAIAVVMKERAKQLYITCGVLFSAGVLLAGGFVHLLSDSNDQFQAMGVTGFPWAFAIAGMTVAGLASLEIVLDRALGDYMESRHEGGSGKATEESVSSTLDTDENSYSPLVAHEEHDEESGDHDHMHIHGGNSFSAVLMSAALSLHSVIEGLGIGASANVSEIQSAFVAVACHKGFTAFALANGLVSAGYWGEDRSQRKYFYLSIGTFVFMSLLGIAIGWGISSAADDNLMTAVLIGITSGSFLYVSMYEILPQETQTIKRERLALLPTIIFFLAGYCLMTMLAIWV